VVIIDCFEIRTERAGNIKARAQCFSHYKHIDTSKYLIGITPNGSVSFISDGYAGRMSDKYIAENSGFTDELLPGDIVLADREFTIHESVSMQYAELLTPEFLKKQAQLPPEAIEKTRKIASLRIHVERVIGLVRNKFRILKGPLEINLLKYKYDEKCLLDYIVHIACILSNLCESIVPMTTSQRVKESVLVRSNESLLTVNFQYCT